MNQVQKKNEALSILSTLIDSYEHTDISKLSKEQLLQLAQLTSIDKLKNQFRNEAKKAKFDLSQKLSAFWSLNTSKGKGKSENTKKAYTHSIDNFMAWLAVENIHLLDVDYYVVDRFVSVLSGSDAQKSKLISGVRAFYSSLERWGDVERNPFLGVKISKGHRVRELIVPSLEEIQALKTHINIKKIEKGRGAQLAQKAACDMEIIIDLLIETGLRCGAVQTITFHHGNVIRYDSKGKMNLEKTLSPELYKRLKAVNLSEYSEIRISKNLENYQLQMNGYKQGERGKAEKAGVNFIHPHSFRHYFSVNHYRTNKDLYALKTLLDHSSVTITEQYLRSLKVYE